MKRRLNDEGWITPGGNGESTVVNNPLLPLTTGLSPYFSFGCLSPRLFFHIIRNVKAEVSLIAYATDAIEWGRFTRIHLFNMKALLCETHCTI